ncbi:hypothetical protein BKD09_28050 [Bradyrhizobium japonicum]|uniref:Transcriptional regulator n=1 Tax=Bradyrhizobium japonicum TaxID=375 RepID=A0A1L3FFV5_BRAJP|nr:hypothetical protein [Bradyrhizobium japonicum]APG12194.1 hypothetical protein BKD09_28050 [Bradyrhizobium japonicum]
MIKADVLKYLIEMGPGRTQLELAQAVHGSTGLTQNVNQDLALIDGTVSRRGEGRKGDPFRYYPK